MEWANLSDLGNLGIAGVAIVALVLFFRSPRVDDEGRMLGGGFAWMLIDAVKSIPTRLEPHFEAIREDLKTQTELTTEVSEKLTDRHRDSDHVLTAAQRSGVRVFVRCVKALLRLDQFREIDLSGPIEWLDEYVKRHVEPYSADDSD
jgi:hypothetical protein